MTTQFHFPKRYDETEAKEGVWFEAEDEHGNSWGKYRVALFTQTAQHVRVEMARWTRQHQKELKSGAYKESDAMIHAFIDIALLDWDEVNFGENGASIPFTKEAAFELFKNGDFDWVAGNIISFATDVRNFNGPEATQEEDAKN